jgi:hypothetical protein
MTLFRTSKKNGKCFDLARQYSLELREEAQDVKTFDITCGAAGSITVE